MLTTARWQSKPSGAFVLQQRGQNIRITERNTEKSCLSLEVTAQKYQLCISWSWPAWGQKDSKLVCAWIHTSLFQDRNLWHLTVTKPPAHLPAVLENQSVRKHLEKAVPCILHAHLLFHYFLQLFFRTAQQSRKNRIKD